MPIDTQNNVLEEANKKYVKFVRLQFTDILGTAKNCTIPIRRFKEVLDDGLWFDGSSIEGFVRIHESDMLLVPDASTFKVLPESLSTTRKARIICDIHTPEGKPFEGDPRYILKKALEEAERIGYSFKVGPELEYYYFKKNSDTELATDTQDFAGYFDLDPLDWASEVRAETMMCMQELGVDIEMGHHEVGEGQHEINFKYAGALEMADIAVTYKPTLKAIANKHGLMASFMPKPVYNRAGSGMHVHQSLWNVHSKKNAFYDEKDKYHLSKVAYHFIGGQMARIKEITLLTNPLVNSYKRLGAFEAPVFISWANINRSALIRIPRYKKGKDSSTRVELRNPDPSANPYLTFAAMLKAGMEGIKNKVEPPEPVEEDVYGFDIDRLAELKIDRLPKDLGEAIKYFEESELAKNTLGEHAFNNYLAAKKAEWKEYNLQVTKWELDKYLPYI